MKLNDLQKQPSDAVLKSDDNGIFIEKNGVELESYGISDIETHQHILRYAYLLLEKTWVTKKLVRDFIKLAAERSGITYRN